jgi:hypothetical protein
MYLDEIPIYIEIRDNPLHSHSTGDHRCASSSPIGSFVPSSAPWRYKRVVRHPGTLSKPPIRNRSNGHYRGTFLPLDSDGLCPSLHRRGPRLRYRFAVLMYLCYFDLIAFDLHYTCTACHQLPMPLSRTSLLPSQSGHTPPSHRSCRRPSGD